MRLTTIVLALAAPLSALHLLLSPDAAWMEGPNPSLLVGVVGPDAAARIAGPGGLATAFVVAGVAGAVLYAVVRFWLWARTRHESGSLLLLSAAVIGALPLLLQVWRLPFSRPWWGAVELPDAFMRFAIVIVRDAYAWGWVVAPLALLLMGVGLLRSRSVSPWVAVVALVAAVLFAVNSVQTGELGALVGMGPVTDTLPIQMYLPAVIAEVAFLISLGVSLLLRDVRAPLLPAAEAPEPAASSVEQALAANGATSEQ